MLQALEAILQLFRLVEYQRFCIKIISWAPSQKKIMAHVETVLLKVKQRTVHSVIVATMRRYIILYNLFLIAISIHIYLGIHLRSALILYALVVPGHMIFLYIISYLGAGHAAYTLVFCCFYLLVALIQVRNISVQSNNHTIISSV